MPGQPGGRISRASASPDRPRARAAFPAHMPPLPRLHVFTDERILSRPDWQSLAQSVLAAGGDRVALHVRGRSLDGRVLYDRVTALEDAAGAAGAMLVVNDRVDVAMTTRADGVQLGETSLPVKEARSLLGPDR